MELLPLNESARGRHDLELSQDRVPPGPSHPLVPSPPLRERRCRTPRLSSVSRLTQPAASPTPPPSLSSLDAPKRTQGHLPRTTPGCPKDAACACRPVADEPRCRLRWTPQHQQGPPDPPYLLTCSPCLIESPLPRRIPQNGFREGVYSRKGIQDADEQTDRLTV